MENTKFKKGQRVVVLKVDKFQKENYKYSAGYKGTINEDVDSNPFVWFDNHKANYTSLGTAVPGDQLKFIDE